VERATQRIRGGVAVEIPALSRTTHHVSLWCVLGPVPCTVGILAGQAPLVSPWRSWAARAGAATVIA
jgi:hypothetical protein